MTNRNLMMLGAAASSLFLINPASAQDAVSARPTSPEAIDGKGEDIIVTGSARQQRRFDVSYAVNGFDADAIRDLAPKNMAELLGTLPGIQIEGTGGEVQNITRVRGIPTDRGYLYFQQDGLPLYHELDGFFFNQGDGMNRTDLMTQRVEVVRGGPAPIYASAAAAVANVITRTGTATPQGEAQLTLGTTGLYRLDAYQSGPIDESTFYAVGGFIRQNDGYRDSGFPADRGGQIRANLLHEFGNGSIKVSGQYTNDHNIFYLSIPTADPNDPSHSLNDYVDFFNGTLASDGLRDVNIRYRDGAGVVQNQRGDLANGRHMRFGNVGLDYEGDFGDWHVSAKGGYTEGRSHFDALYSTSNPVDANKFALGYLSAATTAFGSGVASLGYALAGSNGQTVYDPYADSGLVVSAQYRSIDTKFYSGQGDLSLTRKFETGLGSHDIRVGGYGALWGNRTFAAYQNYLLQVAGNPEVLDLVAYGADGAVKGYVTDNGAIQIAPSLNSGEFDGQVIALYASDTWDVTDRLRIDLGLRHEWYSYNGFRRVTEVANLGDPTTLADNATRAFTGAIVSSSPKVGATNWTVGVNYDLTDNLGFYGRASQLQVPANAMVTINEGSSRASSKAKLFEAGLKLAFGRSYLYLTGFYTKFDPLNASFSAYNPATGRSDQTVTFVGTAENKGVEADGALHVAGPFKIAGSVTMQDPKYLDFANTSGADAGAIEGAQIVRQPKVYGNIRPTLDFALGSDHLSVYGRYDYVSRRYVDVTNTTALPAYGYFGGGITYEHEAWRLQIVGDNLTNAHGLTEGNTAGDTLTGQGTPEAVFGRPLFGRNVRLVVSRKW